MTEAENAATILKAREGENDEKKVLENSNQQQANSIPMPVPHSLPQTPVDDTHNRSPNTPIFPPPARGLPPSPVYIVGNNMIGNITSTSNSNVTTMVPIAETSKTLENNGFNVNSLNCNNNDGSSNKKDESILKPPISSVTSNNFNYSNNFNNSNNYNQFNYQSNNFSTNSNVSNNNSNNNSLPDLTKKTHPSLDDLKSSKLIQASELYKYLNMKEDPPKILVLDVRLRKEFENGHIKTKNIVCLEPFLLNNGQVNHQNIIDRILLYFLNY